MEPLPAPSNHAVADLPAGVTRSDGPSAGTRENNPTVDVKVYETDDRFSVVRAGLVPRHGRDTTQRVIYTKSIYPIPIYIYTHIQKIPRLVKEKKEKTGRP